MDSTTLDVIFITGAPGTGKSTVARNLQVKLKTPIFEFGWIPEFQDKGDGHQIGYIEEESIAFENLVLVIKNYIKHGFKKIIVTDLEDKRIIQLPQIFEDYKFIIFTLFTEDDRVLKSRVMESTRSSGYRDYQSAIKINTSIISRKSLANEIKIDSTIKSPDQIVNIILKTLKDSS
jgi:tRNA uridine 5-carbamoylmethylation protein Kti12